MSIRKTFTFWNRVCAAAVFLVSAVTYLLTIEPSASFWDCGEFIASSYKLEVGHPPGNPVFQLFGKIFTIFGDNMHAAILINAMSAICSALTIFLLYLTIVWFVRRLTSNTVAILASGLVGSLAYCFSDTFWFSAVEGEVYAMSSLFTALVFWMMTKWYDQADEPHALRWIVLISLMMGLSIGIHLLNLLTIPALVFMYYYRRNEDVKFKKGKLFRIFLVGVVILAVILFLIIPWIPKLAAYFDLFFVNVLGLPYNTGAAFFAVGLLAACFWGLYSTLRRKKLFWNTVLMCFTSIIIGFSLFSIDVIRSCAKTPTNEYQPDNAFTLVRYLSREQYGSTPLVYGQYFASPYDLKRGKYWTPMDGKYIQADAPLEAEYHQSGKMLFPRMWSSDERHVNYYRTYTRDKGSYVRGAAYRKPTMGANLSYFFDYQLNWMYWRYFMWNFVGRQNDIHAPSQDPFYGNWESGIGFIDRFRLGDQSGAPQSLSQNKGKNHYYFLPLILGLLGLFYQFRKDKRGSWLTFLMFFMTGIAIVLYLNQPPYQVRERDYAYAGSFYFFSVWIGLGVAAITEAILDRTGHRKEAAVSAAVGAVCLLVPVEMAAQNWDDHDRSGRRTAVEMASNYLNSCGPDAILVTHGDNDTFPLWYAQEVEGIRTDVRICNTSLLGTDWHIDQMKYASNASSPLPLSVDKKQYLYGTNEFIPIVERKKKMQLSEAMAIFRNPREKVSLQSGTQADYFPSRQLVLPVDRDNVIKSGILSEKYRELIPSEIVLTIPEGKDYITKPELFLLDLLSNYKWDRPINLLNMGGDLNIGIKGYLEYQGFSYKFIPLKNTPTSLDAGFLDTDRMYSLIRDKFSFDAVSSDGYYIDYQNCYTFLGVMPLRGLAVTAARSFIENGEEDRAVEMLDMACEVMRRYPIETIPIGFVGNDYIVIKMIGMYLSLGEDDKALAIAGELGDALTESLEFFLRFYSVAPDEFETCASYLNYLGSVLSEAGYKEMGDSYVNLAQKAVEITD